MAAAAPQIRSIYRRLLRELPARSPSILANPSPVQRHIRADIVNRPNDTASNVGQGQRPTEVLLQQAEEYLQYVRSQRLYVTLVERYNPGMNMDEEEKVRLTARRVGMELPVDWTKG